MEQGNNGNLCVGKFRVGVDKSKADITVTLEGEEKPVYKNLVAGYIK